MNAEKHYPYVFKDEDPTSETFGLWSIRWSSSMGFDGYPTYEDALTDMHKEIREEK